MLGTEALGMFALGEIPADLRRGTIGRWMGKVGKIRRVEDLPLVLDFEPDEDFDLGVVIGLWMQHNSDL